MKIKYILHHPIVYQSPLLKYLTKKKIDIEVLFRSSLSTGKYFDNKLNRKIKWDINLLRGFKYKFLKYIGPNRKDKFYPITTEFIKKIFDNETNIIWIHGIKDWYNLSIIFLAKFYKKKVFVRDEVSVSSKKRSVLNNFLNFLFYNFIDNFIDIYLAIGTRNKNYYIKNKIKKEKIVLVPYVVDNNFFYLKKKLKIKKKITYIFVGKLIKEKGCDLLLQSINLLSKYPKFMSSSEFIVAGDGYLKKNLIEYTKENNLTNIKFLGFQNQKMLKKLYQKSDVLILPSNREPWGLVVNEAMAAENAIICSNIVGSSADLIRENFNGYTFKNNNHNDLANKIYKIYRNKKNLNKFKLSSKKIISKWNFEMCYYGLKKGIDKLSI